MEGLSSLKMVLRSGGISIELPHKDKDGLEQLSHALPLSKRAHNARVDLLSQATSLSLQRSLSPDIRSNSIPEMHFPKDGLGLRSIFVFSVKIQILLMGTSKRESAGERVHSWRGWQKAPKLRSRSTTLTHNVRVLSVYGRVRDRLSSLY